MKLSMKDMDLYKVIILLSVVLIPAACGFVYVVNGQLVVAKRAIADAKKRGGDLEEIGALRSQFAQIKKSSRRAQSLKGPGQFFERSILSAATGGIKVDDIQIGTEVDKAVTSPRATDVEVDIKFEKAGKGKFPLPRDFINAVLFNCEATGSKVWKLRQLKMVNEEVSKTRRTKGAPPRTVQDNWVVSMLKFARRTPEKKKKKRR